MLKAVLFDMDGVLVDSEKIFYEADKILLRELGHNMTNEYYSSFVGATAEYMWKKFIEDFNLENSVEELEKRGNEIVNMLLKENKGFPEVPHACEFVKSLSEKYTLIVASSSSMASIERNMNNLGLTSYFKGFVSGRSFEKSKPAPDIFLAAAKLAGVMPEECLVIEDSGNGVEAAKAAGMICIGYENPNSVKQILNKADYVVTDFEGLDYSFVNMVYCHGVNEPWNVFDTKRLSVWEMTEKDLEEFCSIMDMEDSNFISAMPKKQQQETILNPEYMRAYIENMYKFYGYGIWAVKDKITMQNIGFAGVDKTGYISYIIKKIHRRKGYCTEAVTEIIKYVFENTEMKDIYVKIDKRNEASLKAAEKLGFENEEETGNNIICKMKKKNFI